MVCPMEGNREYQHVPRSDLRQCEARRRDIRIASREGRFQERAFGARLIAAVILLSHSGVIDLDPGKEGRVKHAGRKQARANEGEHGEGAERGRA